MTTITTRKDTMRCARCGAHVPDEHAILGTVGDVLCPDCAGHSPAVDDIEASIAHLLRAADYMASVARSMEPRQIIMSDTQARGLLRHAEEIRKHTATIIASIRADVA